MSADTDIVLEQVEQLSERRSWDAEAFYAALARLEAAEQQRDTLADALRKVDDEAEVARTDATGDIYEITEDTLAAVKDALARVPTEGRAR